MIRTLGFSVLNLNDVDRIFQYIIIRVFNKSINIIINVFNKSTNIIMSYLLLNKDYGLTVAASIFTGIGLGQNDLVQMIGGMIISPMANPIIDSIVSGDILFNIVKLIIMILTCIAIGIIYFTLFLPNNFEPTERMLSIADSEFRRYWSDMVYGLVAGIVIYSSYGNYNPNNINILTGIAVGVTVLPAFVNAGIMFGSGLHGYRDKQLTNMGYYGLTSTSVGMIYLISIFLGFSGAHIVDNGGEYIGK